MESRRIMRHTRAFSASVSRGVTLIEITIAIVMLPIIVTAFVLVLSNTMHNAHETAARAEYQSILASATDQLEHDIRLATAFHGATAAPFTDSYKPASWNYSGTGTDDRVLILSLPATTVREGANSRTAVYEDTGAYNCTTELQNNPILTYRTVYFVDNGTLYKRFLTDTSTATCAPQIQKQTCPADDIASWPSSCEARDEIVATHVIGFSIDYLQHGLAAPLPDQYSDDAAVALADSVQITLSLSRTTSPDIRTTSTVTIARTN